MATAAWGGPALRALRRMCSGPGLAPQQGATAAGRQPPRAVSATPGADMVAFASRDWWAPAISGDLPYPRASDVHVSVLFGPRARELSPSRRDRLRGSREAVDEAGGWFAIGLHRCKYSSNHDSLWRGAWQMGASFVFLVGDRLGGVAAGNADTCQGWLRLPSLNCILTPPRLRRPPGGEPGGRSPGGGGNGRAAVGGIPAPATRRVPARAEDHGLPPSVVARCTHHVQLPTVRESSLNVACCGAVVMYDREQKRRLGVCQAAPTEARHADRHSVRPGKRPALGCGAGERSEARWLEVKARALDKASAHCREQDGGELALLRLALDGQDGLFVSFALPPEVHVLEEEGSGAAPPSVQRLRVQAGEAAAQNEGAGEDQRLLRALRAAAAAGGGSGLRARLSPLLVHVRCRDLGVAHGLLKDQGI
ncbi:unnamed protein product [Prorocentrum cordatum]|uniref:Uncharacterized protein n=1 Tax=Prorocentrum cordatum TaxID=2364126 RepID=A0ABN9VIL8_9DINO|nr:unnamed protein product [Polarella glacialis]